MILKSNLLAKILKVIFEISIIILFAGSYLKIFSTLPPSIYIKLTFSLIYIWFTIGMNVNFILPLIKIIDRNIKKL